jgi:hypothetical protein
LYVWGKYQKQNMKQSIYRHPFAYLMLIAFIFFGCGEQNKTKQRKCRLIVRNGSGWSSGGSIVECDSFQMHGTRKASAWVDGYKMNIEAEDVIYPHVK